MDSHIISVSVATTAAEVITLPICTVKTNYQNTSTNIIGCVREIYSTRGIAGFYKASPFAVSSQVLSTTLKYVGYENMKLFFAFKPFAGLIAGTTTSLITHPIDVLKIHYQMNTPFIPVLREHGIVILYRGYSKSFMKVSISSMCFFPIYDTVKNMTNNPSISSFISAVLSTTIMQPVDYMKVRHVYGMPFTVANSFRGLSLNLARVVPHFMIMMTTLEYIKNAINTSS